MRFTWHFQDAFTITCIDFKIFFFFCLTIFENVNDIAKNLNLYIYLLKQKNILSKHNFTLKFLPKNPVKLEGMKIVLSLNFFKM